MGHDGRNAVAPKEGVLIFEGLKSLKCETALFRYDGVPAIA